MDNRATDSNTVAFNVEETVPSNRANAPVWRCGEVNQTEFQVAELYSIAGHVDGSLILSCFFCWKLKVFNCPFPNLPTRASTSISKVDSYRASFTCMFPWSGIKIRNRHLSGRVSIFPDPVIVLNLLKIRFAEIQIIGHNHLEKGLSSHPGWPCSPSLNSSYKKVRPRERGNTGSWANDSPELTALHTDEAVPGPGFKSTLDSKSLTVSKSWGLFLEQKLLWFFPKIPFWAVSKLFSVLLTF